MTIEEVILGSMTDPLYDSNANALRQAFADPPPDNRGKASAGPPPGPNVPDAVADRVILETLSGARRGARATRDHRARALIACNPMIASVAQSGPPPGPRWAQQTLDSVAQALAEADASKTQAEWNLDTLVALLSTDYSGDLDGRRTPGYTRDRETMLLRAARLIREARKGEPLEVFLTKCGGLYGPEE